MINLVLTSGPPAEVGMLFMAARGLISLGAAACVFLLLPVFRRLAPERRDETGAGRPLVAWVIVMSALLTALGALIALAVWNALEPLFGKL